MVTNVGLPKSNSDISHKPLKPDTTEQQDMVSAGQRKINLIWETTQSRIALLVVSVGTGINAILIIALLFLTKDVASNTLAVISICLQSINITVGIVIGFYFSRTNHSNIGGVGAKESPSSKGTR